MSVNNTSQNLLASLTAINRGTGTSGKSGDWFDAMAEAWGRTLDEQANKIQVLSENIGLEGDDMPGRVTALTAESLRMQFLSQSSQTSISSIGSALGTMARKQ